MIRWCQSGDHLHVCIGCVGRSTARHLWVQAAFCSRKSQPVCKLFLVDVHRLTIQFLHPLPFTLGWSHLFRCARGHRPMWQRQLSIIGCAAVSAPEPFLQPPPWRLWLLCVVVRKITLPWVSALCFITRRTVTHLCLDRARFRRAKTVTVLDLDVSDRCLPRVWDLLPSMSCLGSLRMRWNVVKHIVPRWEQVLPHLPSGCDVHIRIPRMHQEFLLHSWLAHALHPACPLMSGASGSTTMQTAQCVGTPGVHGVQTVPSHAVRRGPRFHQRPTVRLRPELPLVSAQDLTWYMVSCP